MIRCNNIFEARFRDVIIKTNSFKNGFIFSKVLI
jgi:hypothetical protein